MNIILIAQGAIGGLAYALSGYANADKRTESFDYWKFVPTIVIAGVVGGIAGFTGQDYGILVNSSMAAGITVVVEKVFKAVKKALKKA
jgi:hypothetical protein